MKRPFYIVTARAEKYDGTMHEMGDIYGQFCGWNSRTLKQAMARHLDAERNRQPNRAFDYVLTRSDFDLVMREFPNLDYQKYKALKQKKIRSPFDLFGEQVVCPAI